MTRSAPALLLLACLAGCSTDHYLVVADSAPLYMSPTSDQLVGRVPRYAHAALVDGLDDASARVYIRHDGKAGYAPRHTLRLFSYLDPSLDDGEDRAETIGRELREAQLAHIGKRWPKHVKQAIRRQRVVRGMTARMVEVAWGWPSNVEAGSTPGAVRWVYKHDDVEVVQKWVGDPWTLGGACGPGIGFGWRGGLRGGFTGGYWRHGLHNGYAAVRLEVTEERTVHLDKKGRVERVTVRRYLKS